VTGSRDCHWAKKKQEMSRMPSGLALPARGQNFCIKEKMSSMPSGRGRHRQISKWEKQKMSRMPSGLPLLANGPKF
jgi:hypothetical protein